MFTLMSNCVKSSKKRGEKKATFVVCGLNNAGKTTISKGLQGKLLTETKPTVGVRFDNKWQQGKYKLEVFDLGGGPKIRKIWPSYYAEAHGAIFVVDAADVDRLDEAKACLLEMAASPVFVGKSILIFANKQDLPTAVGPDELFGRLGLDSPELAECSSHITACIALQPEGGTVDARLQEGMKWLLASAAKQWVSLNERIVREVAEQTAAEKAKREQKKIEVTAMKEERRLKQEAEDAAAAAVEAASGGQKAPEGPAEHVWSQDEQKSLQEPIGQQGSFNPLDEGANGGEAAAALSEPEPSGGGENPPIPSSPGPGEFALPGMQTFPEGRKGKLEPLGDPAGVAAALP